MIDEMTALFGGQGTSFYEGWGRKTDSPWYFHCPDVLPFRDSSHTPGNHGVNGDEQVRD